MESLTRICFFFYVAAIVDSFPMLIRRERITTINLSSKSSQSSISHLNTSTRTSALAASFKNNADDQQQERLYGLRRDQCLSKLLMTSAFLLNSVFSPDAAIAAEDSPPPAASKLTVKEDEAIMFKTPSGLKYIEVREGTGPTPKYGQLCAIQYTGYLKLSKPGAKAEEFESSAFLVKHGNGKTIPGVEEGIHTMKVGGKRRLIIPPKLGYIESGLGPLPQYPWNRYKLNSLLTEMIEVKGGNLIFDIELKSVINDEASQGYYDDKEPTAEEIAFIRTRLLKEPPNAAEQM